MEFGSRFHDYVRAEVREVMHSRPRCRTKRYANLTRHARWGCAPHGLVALRVRQRDPASAVRLALVRNHRRPETHQREFIDPPEKSWADWRDRLSLDVRVWFSSLRVTRSTGEEIPPQEFIDGGVRWWDGLYAGDPRSGGEGIAPVDQSNAPDLRH